MARAALEDPLKVFMFNAVIDGFVRFNFSEITGIKKTTDVAEIREGGWNATPRKSAGITKYENITFKRGQVASGAGGGDDDFILWLNQVHSTTRYGTAANYRRDGQINQFAATGAPGHAWDFIEAWPTVDTPFSDLNGLTSDNSFESLELTHEGYHQLFLPPVNIHSKRTLTMLIQLPGAIRLPNNTFTKDVELHEMGGAEEDILVDARRDPKKKDTLKVPFRERALQILSRCTDRIGDLRRPDGMTPKTAPLFFYETWRKAYLADRNFAWVRLRQESTVDGDFFKFDTQCTHCGNVPKEKASLDLNEQKVNSIPLSAFSDPDYFLITLPKSGKVITWDFATGEEEEDIEELLERRADTLRTSSLLLRVRCINGVKATREDLADIGRKDLDFLATTMDKRAFGMDMDITIPCTNPDCGKDYTTKVPFHLNSFFFPSEALSSLRTTSFCSRPATPTCLTRRSWTCRSRAGRGCSLG